MTGPGKGKLGWPGMDVDQRYRRALDIKRNHLAVTAVHFVKIGETRREKRVAAQHRHPGGATRWVKFLVWITFL